MTVASSFEGARSSNAAGGEIGGARRALPPGPPPRRGIVDAVTYYANFYVDPLGFVEERFAKYGDIYYAPSGGPAGDPSSGLFVLKHPDHLRELMSVQASKFKKEHTAFEQLSKVLGDGLLTSDGEVWKRQRRLVQPAFTRTRLASYAETMVDEADKTVSSFEAGETRDMSHEMMELTLRVVSRTLFGYDASNDVEAVRCSMRTLQGSLATPDVLPKWMPSPTRRAIERAVKSLDDIVFGLIRARKAGEGKPDLLQILVDGASEDGGAAERLSEREARDQLMTLFLAGHETTSHALSWTLYLLSKNPNAEIRLAREIETVVGKRKVRLEDLEAMPYLGQVIQESLRLYPPAYMIARRASEDAEIGGYVIPAKSEVIAWIYMTHRDPRWFPDPLAFDPDRFSKERESALKPFSFVPFGAGPRACIGKAFAMIEAQLLLATLVQRYRFQLAPGQKVEPSPRITMLPKFGLKMKIDRR